MFDGFQIIHFAGCRLTPGVDGQTHGDLRIDTSVVPMVSHGLGDQQNSDSEHAEAADGGQNWVGVYPHYLPRRQALLGVTVHQPWATVKACLFQDDSGRARRCAMPQTSVGPSA